MKTILIILLTGVMIPAISQMNDHNISLFRVDSINKDEVAQGQTYRDAIAGEPIYLLVGNDINTLFNPKSVTADIYTNVDTLSTGDTGIKLKNQYYSTADFKEWSLILEYTITSPGDWDTSVHIDRISSKGFKHVMTPIDSTQAVKASSTIIWDYIE